jgi:hypothetical protein
MTDVTVKNFEVSSGNRLVTLSFESDVVPEHIHEAHHLAPEASTLNRVGANLVWRVGEHSVEFSNGGNDVDEFLKDREEFFLVCMAQGKIRYLQVIELPLTEASPAPMSGQGETDLEAEVQSSAGAARPKAF